MKVQDTLPVRVADGLWDPVSVARGLARGPQEDPFYVMDLGEVVRRHRRWRELMPRVEPFYAVKCNDDRLLLKTLAALGTGFDCASRAEIDLITSIGVSADRIIFANPAKMASHIRHAAAAGALTMTFDCEHELTKIRQIAPQAQLVIRIRCDAADAQCPLGIKFGCDPVEEAPRLLKVAAAMQLEVVGVSFHVGSGARDPSVYARAVLHARNLFDAAAAAGREMALLDLGGGFPGNSGTDISEVAGVINAALNQHFPSSAVRVIAEPGRYFAAAAYTLACMVHAKRELVRKSDLGAEGHTMYFITDGVYGSFNCVLYDHQEVVAEPLEPTSDAPAPCSVWGPSCDGLDCVLPSTLLPPMAAGSWLVFRDMGAYTLPIASPFNGFPVPSVVPVVGRELFESLKDVCGLTELVDSLPLDSPLASPLDSPLDSPSLSPVASVDDLPVFVECAIK